MKITFVLPTLSLAGGIRSTSILAERMVKRGHEVFVVSIPKRRPNLRQQMRSLRRGKGWISVTKNNPSHFDNINVPHNVINRFRPVINADVPDADVVIATWWETAEWVANLSVLKGAKVYFIRGYESLFEYLPKEKVEATYSLPMHKTTTSKRLVDWLQSYGDSNISLVPNSVDTEQFYAPLRGKQATPTVGMMYSTVNWKGCDISLKAFSLAAQNIPNLRFVAFGTQHPSSNLPLPPSTEYVCQPPQNTIKDIYAKCDAWLFGSRSQEGFGLPILEAMACRTPVIGTPAGAAPELLADGAGILVKPEAPDEMARAIERVCRFSDQEWRAMLDIAYAKATDYTWDDATELFETALYTAIERQQRGDLSGSDRQGEKR
jgi:glycosyltransferase involved in cell wall biosynthesis